MTISDLAAVAATAAAILVGGAYFAFPNIETTTVTKTRTVTRPAATPTRPTLAQFKRLMRPIEAIRDEYRLGPDGQPQRCFLTDSSFSADVFTGITWQAQWCWQVPQREALLGGLVG